MLCPQCGTENREDSAYCRHCGTRIAMAADAAQADASGAAANAGGYANASEPRRNPGAQDPFGQQPPQSANPYTGPQGDERFAGQAGQPYRQPPVSAGGCIGAAWRDVTSSEGWMGKACLLGIVNAVPILNWVVMGYILRWARQLSGGIHMPMPKGLFVDRAFTTGFFAAVVGALFWVVSWVVGFIVGWVPLIGSLAALVLGVLVSLFADAAIIRMAIVDRLGAAFDFGRIWRAYKRALGSLFCASLVPTIVAALVMMVLIVVFLMIAGAIIGSSAAVVSLYAPHHAIKELAGLPALFIASGGIGAVVLMVVLWVLCAMVLAVAQLVSYRAVGHWAARVSPDWGAEAPEARQFSCRM